MSGSNAPGERRPDRPLMDQWVHPRGRAFSKNWGYQIPDPNLYAMPSVPSPNNYLGKYRGDTPDDMWFQRHQGQMYQLPTQTPQARPPSVRNTSYPSDPPGTQWFANNGPGQQMQPMLVSQVTPQKGSWQYSLKPNEDGTFDMLSSHPEIDRWEPMHPMFQNLQPADATRILKWYRDNSQP